MAPHAMPDPFAFTILEPNPGGEVRGDPCQRSDFERLLDDLILDHTPSDCDTNWQNTCQDETHFKNGSLINVVLENGAMINGSAIQGLRENPCLYNPVDNASRVLFFTLVLMVPCFFIIVFMVYALKVVGRCGPTDILYILCVPFLMVAKALYSIGVCLIASCQMIVKALFEGPCRCARGVFECLCCVDKEERHQAEQGWRPARPPTPIPGHTARGREFAHCNQCEPIELVKSKQRMVEPRPSKEIQQPGRVHYRQPSIGSWSEQDGSAGMQTPLPAYDEIFMDHSIHEWDVNRPRRSGRNGGYGFPS